MSQDDSISSGSNVNQSTGQSESATSDNLLDSSDIQRKQNDSDSDNSTEEEMPSIEVDVDSLESKQSILKSGELDLYLTYLFLGLLGCVFLFVMYLFLTNGILGENPLLREVFGWMEEIVKNI